MIAGMMQLNAQQNSKKDSIKQHSIKEVIITSSYGTKKNERGSSGGNYFLVF